MNPQHLPNLGVAKRQPNVAPKVSLNLGMGCFVWIWLLFFQWVPRWFEGLVLFVVAYLVEIIIRAVTRPVDTRPTT